ncbi:alpha/beta hydrolase [Niabella pedocola]|uniref:Alpha/beta hydrolase n=1 Tax=Niabella pedocola TaxID=1752077 RepID=A0ABS8PKP6_9BACT|nr:alpha/beta hydrolase [Niabella pedocola]MCD2421672.1 alpha/beta hydrolase [Niabella pedocola]
MKKQVLFIQGGGNGGYKTDIPLVASLQAALGSNYEVHYPKMSADETAPDFAAQWLRQIGEQIAVAEDGLILAGHSLGASLLVKYLSENTVKTAIAGVFLVAPPFWNGNQDWVQPLKLQDGFAEQLPQDLPIYYYQCRDDEVVPFAHFIHYQQQLPGAIFRELASGGHQLHNDLSIVATDIKRL